MKKILFFIFLSFVSVNVINADCTDYEDVANKIEYSVFNIYNTDQTVNRIMIDKISEDMYLKVRNSYNSDEDTYTYSDSNEGLVFIDSKTVARKINYEIRVYTNDASCKNTVLRTIKVTTPKYNHYVTSDLCVGHYEDVKLCHPFYNVGEMTLDEFNKQVTEEIAKIDNSNLTFWDYVLKYLPFVLIPVILISIIYIVRIILLKRRKKQYV